MTRAAHSSEVGHMRPAAACLRIETPDQTFFSRSFPLFAKYFVLKPVNCKNKYKNFEKVKKTKTFELFISWKRENTN